MRIDRLHIENFKKFATQDFDLHPHFTLLAGGNGSGKTTVLDALAVAMGVWLIEVPDTMLSNSRRKIEEKEIRLEPSLEGDRIQFRQRRPVVIRVTGQIGERSPVTWTRQIRATGKSTTNVDAAEALEIIADIYRRDNKLSARCWPTTEQGAHGWPRTKGFPRRPSQTVQRGVGRHFTIASVSAFGLLSYRSGFTGKQRLREIGVDECAQVLKL